MMGLPWMLGDVTAIEAHIRENYDESEASMPINIRISRARHARLTGYSFVRALAMTPENSPKTGRPDPARTLELIQAVTKAVQIIIDQSLADSLGRERKTAPGAHNV
jgi:hypothetical protein